ncbi:MAG: SH3 domain-containing protein [Chloroflexi bacterium]|nr:SH3 domain-containing protein [Chloroflexota bacterium]
MRRSSYGSRRGCSVGAIAGWALLLVVAGGLIWFGFFRNRGGGQPEPGADVTVAPSPTASLIPLVTQQLPTATTESPTDLPEPTAIAPTPVSPAVARIVAGVDGANVRTGSDTSYERIGYLDPGAEARVIGRYDGWWQIDYNGVTGWVYGEIVTASNTEDVPEVVPPTLTPMPATATPPPPTATTESVDPTIETASPTTTATVTPDVQTATPGPAPGDVVANAFSVEGAPGPFDVDADIWFNGDVTCAAGQDVNYTHLGAWVEQTAQFQVSWSNETLTSGQRFTWRDRIAIASPGTYNLWLRVCFGETNCTNLSGPVVVEVQ